MSGVWVLIKATDHDHGTDFKVIGVYEDRADLDARVSRIASVNSQYPMQQLGANTWQIGPLEDEGFFGARPVRLVAQSALLHDVPEEVSL